jgi:hypothetical protein
MDGMGGCGCDSFLVFRAMPAAAAWPWLAGSRWSCLALVCLYLEETTQTKAAFLYFLVAMCVQ